MLTKAETEFLSNNLSESTFDQIIELVNLYCSIRAMMVAGVSTANAVDPMIPNRNAQRIDIDGTRSPLTLHGPHGYSPKRAGKALAFHHDNAGEKPGGQNIGDISYSVTKHRFTLNLLFGWHNGPEIDPPPGWSSYIEQESRNKIVLQDIGASSDLSCLRDGLQSWRRLWFS